MGVYVWKGEKALLNQHIFKVQFDKIDVDKNYFIYSVKYFLQEMQSKTHGATMKHITKRDFDNIKIPFPDLDMQNYISKQLSHVSNIIELRKNNLKSLMNSSAVDLSNSLEILISMTRDGMKALWEKLVIR